MLATKGRPPQDAAASRRPISLIAPARISSNLRQELQMPPLRLPQSTLVAKASPPRRSKPFAKASVSSRLRTLLPPQKFQRPYFHSLPHSLQHAQNITPVFPARSALFLRSCAQERKSTPLFSCACARFRRYAGVAEPVLCCARLTTRRRAGSSRLATSGKRDSARMLHELLASNNQPSQEAPWKDDNF
jgi:hypothetical protein